MPDPRGRLHVFESEEHGENQNCQCDRRPVDRVAIGRSTGADRVTREAEAQQQAGSDTEEKLDPKGCASENGNYAPGLPRSARQ